MNCPECGAENRPEARTCVECGSPLPEVESDASSPPTPVVGDSFPEEDDQTIVTLRGDFEAPEEKEASPSTDESVDSDEDATLFTSQPRPSVPPPLSESSPIAESPRDHEPAAEAAAEAAPSAGAGAPSRSNRLVMIFGATAAILFFCGCFCLIILGVAAVSDPAGFEDLIRQLFLVAG